MPVTITTQFDCTQRQFVVYLAMLIYRVADGNITPSTLSYFFDSCHPAERASLQVAEAIFELLTGDSPDYDDDPDDEDMDVDHPVLEQLNSCSASAEDEIEFWRSRAKALRPIVKAALNLVVEAKHDSTPYSKKIFVSDKAFAALETAADQVLSTLDADKPENPDGVG